MAPTTVAPERSAFEPAQKFGTFMGVFTPSLLTILGVMMYLRFGWVVGNLGLPLALLVVVLASSISLITALSASAVATNMRVGVGGEYYMISRSLGLELGGAIGIPLFLCRTLSLTLYCFGLAKALLMAQPEGLWGLGPQASEQLVAAGFVILTTAIAGKSASMSLRLQIPVMAAVGVSLLALGWGALSGGLRAPNTEALFLNAKEHSFWYILAVFFPAVTGFAVGIGMSGDLRDPRKSIPRGTILAVLAGTAVYLIVPVILGISARTSPESLARNELIWLDVAVGGAWLIYPGMWGAILSSAFGSVLGGSRVLQALALDGLAPRFLGRASRTGQPTVATWVAGGIALAAVALGSLDAVAVVVTIFFLTLYVMINLSAGLERLVGDPSFRPTIRIPWPVSLAGCGGAIVVMFLINRWACLAAVGLELLLYLHLRRRSLEASWGDLRAGLWMALARFALLKLRSLPGDPRNWRPNILVFAEDVAERIGLVRMASWFNQNRGVLTVCRVVEGVLGDGARDLEAERAEMDDALAEHGLVAFSEVDVVPEFEAGVVGIAQANGIAGLHSNTLLFGWPSRPERLEALLRLLRPVTAARKSVLLTRLVPPEGPLRRRRIDVWWRGKQHNGDLMLLLAHLLSLNEAWRGATITVRSIVPSEHEREAMRHSLDELLPSARIVAQRQVVVQPPDRSADQIMHEASADADVVLLGMNVPEPGTEAAYARRLEGLVAGLPSVILVRNAGPFAGELI